MIHNNSDSLDFLLTKLIDKKNFYQEPFPHLIIEDALPKNFYKVLSDNFPKPPHKLELYDNTICYTSDKNIYDNKNTHEYWTQILKYLASPEYSSKLLEIFKEQLIKRYPKKFKINELTNKLSIKDNEEKIDSKLTGISSTMFYSPVEKTSIPKKVNGKKLEIHCDSATKLFTSILYFRDMNDKSLGGELLLHAWKFRLPFEIKKIILTRGIHFINSIIRNFQFLFIKKKKSLKYKANCLVIFFGNEDALHSVDVREKGSPVRRSIHSGIHYNEDLWDSVSFIDRKVGYLKNRYEKLRKYLNPTKIF